MKKIKKCIIFFVFGILILTPGFAKKNSHFVIGTEEGEGELISPRQVKEGPDGNIYVYDPMDVFIKVYSPSGKFINKIGGKGEGPGEVKRADGLRFGFTHNKKLFFTEYFTGHRWITFMNLDGSLNKTLKLQIKVTFFGIGQVVFLPDGRFLIQLSYPGGAKRSGDYFLYNSPLKLFLVDAKGKMLSKIKEENFFTRISFLSDGADLGLPFTPRFLWCPIKHNSVLFADGLSKNLQVINFKGEPTSKIKTTLPECRKVTQKDLSEWREGIKETYSLNQSRRGWYKQFGKVIEKYEKSIYDKKPNIGDISLTPENNILVGVARYDNSTKNEYRLINQEGKTIIKVVVPVFDLSISKNFIFFKTLDEDDIITVHCLKRQGTEKDDLLQVTKLKL